MNKAINSIVNAKVIITLVTGDAYTGKVIWNNGDAIKFISEDAYGVSDEHLFAIHHVVGFQLLTDK